MPDFPPGHAWYYAVYLPVPSHAHARVADQNPFVTIPDDYKDMPDWESLGIVIEIEQIVCMKCRRTWRMAAFQPECPADSNPDYLRGGKKDRAWRHSAPAGQSGAEVAARQARREDPALMQASRISGLT